ncbi:MAG: hypothetical protein Crog4KO_12010 [Crocinitomicaceae bacterium]
MKKWFFIALLFASCSPGVARKEAPDNLIKKDKMVEVLTELMKLEGHVSVKYIQVPKYKGVMKASADSLFKAEGITAKQFEKSYDYYAYQQKDLRIMYEKVLDNLNHELTDLELEEQKKK